MNKKQMTVKDVSKITGVTVRTLHYYDEIGLLTPEGATEAGYRLYGEKDLEKLQQIMFYKELGFALKDIAGIINSPKFEKEEALVKHRHLLNLKAERLNNLVFLIDDILKGEKTMGFKEFDSSNIDDIRKQYEQEAREKWGNTPEYKQSAKKTSKYSKEDWDRINSEAETIFGIFAELMEKEADQGEKNDAVRKWQQHITKNYYDCSDEILLGLGEMYVCDERFRKNIDKHKEGLAQYISDAIKECVK